MAKKTTIRTISGSRLESIYASYVKEYEKMLKIAPEKVSPIKFTKAELKVRYEQSKTTAKDAFIKQSIGYQSYNKYYNKVMSYATTGKRRMSSFPVSYDEYNQFYTKGGKGMTMGKVIDSENAEIPEYVVNATSNLVKFMKQPDVRRGIIQYMKNNEVELSPSIIKNAESYLQYMYEDAKEQGLNEKTIRAREKRLNLSDEEKVLYYLTHLSKREIRKMTEEENALVFEFAKEAGLNKEVIQQAISYKEEDVDE